MAMAFTGFTALSLVLLSYIYTAAKGDIVQVTPPELGRTFATLHGKPLCEVCARTAHTECTPTPCTSH